MPEVGALLGAKYRVLALLGVGGMGSVYRAENVLTGKQVALKLVHPQCASSPDAAERLLREARAASKLSHPNVVDVYDVVRDNGTLCLVMELLQGQSLRDYLRSAPRPPLPQMIAILLGAMSGVAAAHEQGVIHRDLKPDNIFLVQVPGMSQPIAKVLDFGIAKMAEIRGSTLTQTGAAIGTPVYMSLEQLRGDKDIDIRADVYAFGVMLYEALAGQPPFDATSLSELAIKVATTDAAPLDLRRPDVPASLCAIIDKAIRRDRTQRWPDMPSMIKQLAPFARAPNDSYATASAQPYGATPHSRSMPLQAAQPSPTPWAPHGTMAATTTLPQTLPEAPAAADSLIAHDLAGSHKPRHGSTALWLSAAVLSVAAVSAFLLLDEPPAPKPLPSAARLTPPLSPATAAAPVPAAPALQLSPTIGQLQFERAEPAEPPPPLGTAEAADEPSAKAKHGEGAPSASPRQPRRDEPANTAAKHRKPARVQRVQREHPRVQAQALPSPEDAPKPDREKPPARESASPARAKSATELLGF